MNRYIDWPRQRIYLLAIAGGRTVSLPASTSVDKSGMVGEKRPHSAVNRRWWVILGRSGTLSHKFILIRVGTFQEMGRFD